MLTKCSAYVSFKNRLTRSKNDFPQDRRPYITTGMAETPQGNLLTQRLINALIGKRELI